jgi:acetyl/propionyl-CoA carboxylase alpha subunit
MAASLKPQKVLVANRSEIACRVFQTCREMGLKTVAIVAPGDEEARHLTYADEVHRIPGYLDISSIVDVSRKAGVSLIHPGYGFLSERSAFVSALEKAGIGFIGPTAETMDLMGGKIVAKEIATQAGVPTLPWAKVAQGGDLKTAAARVGYPLLLKAAAGGGGKGMRRVDRPEDLDSAAESAAAEAVAAFGDGTLFLERLLERPRHIEVQVFGDGHGHGVHLNERECSLQRRHQKVWEEATAPNLPAKTREGLFAAALSLVRHVKYRSAGTLEFLVDDSGEFFFLEMNTRLQVEHPVSELVTGVDLVRAQLEQALNPKATILKESPAPRGHAIEVRLYAEDPYQDFMPTPGKVERLRWPTGPGIRVDSGIEEGQMVGTSFDSMLAKLIVFAEKREHAIARMRYALDETVVFGLGTNQAWLRSLCDQPAVIEGKVWTSWLGTHFAGEKPKLSDAAQEVLAAARNAGLISLGQNTSDSTSPAGSVSYPSPFVRYGAGGAT